MVDGLNIKRNLMLTDDITLTYVHNFEQEIKGFKTNFLTTTILLDDQAKKIIQTIGLFQKLLTKHRDKTKILEYYVKLLEKQDVAADFLDLHNKILITLQNMNIKAISSHSFILNITANKDTLSKLDNLLIKYEEVINSVNKIANNYLDSTAIRLSDFQQRHYRKIAIFCYSQIPIIINYKKVYGELLELWKQVTRKILLFQNILLRESDIEQLEYIKRKIDGLAAERKRTAILVQYKPNILLIIKRINLSSANNLEEIIPLVSAFRKKLEIVRKGFL